MGPIYLNKSNHLKHKTRRLLNYVVIQWILFKQASKFEFFWFTCKSSGFVHVYCYSYTASLSQESCIFILFPIREVIIHSKTHTIFWKLSVFATSLEQESIVTRKTVCYIGLGAWKTELDWWGLNPFLPINREVNLGSNLSNICVPFISYQINDNNYSTHTSYGCSEA